MEGAIRAQAVSFTAESFLNLAGRFRVQRQVGVLTPKSFAARLRLGGVLDYMVR